MMTLYERILAGKPRLFLTARDFLEGAIEYFQWADENGMTEEVIGWYQGSASSHDIKKMRAYTKQGLATYLGIPVNRLDQYKTRGEDWAEAMAIIEQIMFDQKFTGASSGLLNATIISRDLGLADRQELTGRDGEPLQQVVQYQLPSNGRDHVAPDPADSSDSSDL